MGVRVRVYGDGPPVLLLHGGPGTPGHMAPLGRALQDRWRAIEPLQRRRGDVPLSVAVHVDDLDAVVDAEAGGSATLVGSSWGAMLGLCYAAEHPAKVQRLVLIGCGTFDTMARALLVRARLRRFPEPVRARLVELGTLLDTEPDDERCDDLFREMGAIIFPHYSHDPVTDDLEIESYDYRGHKETWNDMLRLQAEGVLPARFARIEAPVLMLHGEFDPHPGAAIHEGLRPHVRDLTYRSFAKCGHFPWIERHAREEFLAVLRDALP